ncbi:cupin domain-containing protein [Paenibacillus cremeus]|uniref:Cupin domain-containing protein n=1 Tax=Paenibacillus cremeus TaxID=2163881 RepID=A0A559KEI8_9BACL|nr:cupin domain-containing protein [Paenibacillus cremeus]TVY10537.1 cupin domain-containing protein [Paenibacillus cremeus]
MRKYRLQDLQLQPSAEGHMFQSVLPGAYLYSGGLAFCKPGERSHTNDGPEGRDYHVHTDCEAFFILQGHGFMELNGEMHPVQAGDVVVVEPGEDHHLHSSQEDPVVTLWCHAGPQRHKQQVNMN